MLMMKAACALVTIDPLRERVWGIPLAGALAH
jgi:hypothetical protein